MPLVGRRVGRPGLLGLAARTAVVAGTASAVSGSVNRRQANKAAEQQQAAAAEQQAAYEQQQAMAQQAAQQAAAQQAAAAPAAGSSVDDRISRLKELGELKNAGILTEEEFAAEKAKILNS